MNVTINPLRIVNLLFYITSCIFIVSIIRSILVYVYDRPTLFGFARLLNVDTESNLPTWYSSSLLLAASFILYFIGDRTKYNAGKFASYWKILSGIFLFLSIDEACCIHEMIGLKIQSVFNTSGFVLYAWVIPWSIMLLIIWFTYMQFLKSLPIRVNKLFLLSAICYIGGAIGVEMIEAQYHSINGGQIDLIYSLMTNIEEIMEMFGVVIFIYALGIYIDLKQRNYTNKITTKAKTVTEYNKTAFLIKLAARNLLSRKHNLS
ncbi:MAG: hypothetical protein ACYC27_02440 [Armatimonadota bacterium]